MTLLALVLAAAGQPSAAQQQPAAAPAAQTANPGSASVAASPVSNPYGTVVMRYCVACHNDKLRTAELSLQNVSLDEDKIGANAAIWEKVVAKLRASAMPPVGFPRPDKDSYEGLATYLETQLDRASAAKPDPGRPLVHRLNRAEYANVIRDLLGLDIDSSSLLPPDDASYGFDNIGDVLTVSPTLFDRYLAAASKISSLAIGDLSQRPSSDVYTISRNMLQTDRASEDLPFGTRGGISIRHYFPVDGEYVVQVRLQRDRGRLAGEAEIIGLAQPHQIDVRFDDEKLQEFTIGGEKQRAKQSESDEGYLRTADAGLKVRFAAKAGEGLVGVSFLNDFSEPEGVLRRVVGVQQTSTDDDIPGVRTVTIAGPYNIKGPGDTASRRKIFVCQPGADSGLETACAKKILATLARRAYRRPVTDHDVQTLLSFYQQGRKKGSFDAGIEMALRRILVSPEFLFRIERDPANTPPGAVYSVSNLELASRLSFFLWSSIPDDQLLDLAEHGKLKDPAVLEQQVRRMLADSRSESLVSNFAGQWLYLRNLEQVVPDPLMFPEFDESLRQAMEQETSLFLQSMLHEDRSVLDLLNADYTFLNERLARHYGIPNIYGSHFRRVTLTDEARRGLVGQGSILTVTSYPTRTSPTLRGKWLLENILGAPPPAPPNNVPSLQDRNADGQILSVRQQMEQHRKNPECASCHARMDPLGFALENFDAIGRWRTTSGAGNEPIDSSGVLPDGTKFNGPAELRKILLDRRDQFVSTVTEKLLTYALGRGLDYYDDPAVRKIVRDSAASDYRWSSLVVGIVNSTPFQMRRAEAP